MAKRNNSAARELLFNLIRRQTAFKGLCVNRAHTMSTRHPLVKALIKAGKIKTVREPAASAMCRSTHLVPTDGVYVEGPVHCPECKAQITHINHNDMHRPGCTVEWVNFYWIPDHVSSPLFSKQAAQHGHSHARRMAR